MATITGGTELLEVLTRVVGVLEDPEPMWRAIGFSMKENTRQRIADGVDASGKSFVPSYRALAEGGQTLRDTGRLMNSITFFATKNDVTWGVPAEFPYARILNEGGVIRARSKPFLCFKVAGRWVKKTSVRMPERRFLAFTSTDQLDVLDIVASFIGEK